MRYNNLDDLKEQTAGCRVIFDIDGDLEVSGDDGEGLDTTYHYVRMRKGMRGIEPRF